MKIKTILLIYSLLALFSFGGFSQNVRIMINGNPYYNGDAIYVNCNQQFTLSCQGLQNGNWGNIETNGVTNLPSGWSVSYNKTNDGLVILSATITTNANGGSFRVVPIFYDDMWFAGNTSSLLSFSSSPPLYGSYQSNSYNVQIESLFSTYSSTTWETRGGLRVNGGTSYTGGTNATVSTTDFGGKLLVRANNTCGGSGNWNEIVVGPPYIASKTVNGGAAQSVNYVGSSSTLNIFTDGTANGCNWSTVGGSGSISPNGFSCSAFVSSGNFLRVRAESSNQFGNGEAYVFYLLNGSGYRMASPNPTKGDKVKVEFVDKQLADDLLNSMVLYNEKEKVMWSFDKASAKTNKHFKDKDFVEIETKDLSKGLYYLHLQIGEKKYIERLGVE